MNCEHCGKPHNKLTGEINRARKAGLKLFCDKRCFGLSRRKYKAKTQRVAEKKLYDEQYRAKNAALLKAKKAEYFRRTYDPRQAAVYRKTRMHKHVEYCRQPEYKIYKRRYDAEYRAKCDYGDFWEAGMLLIQIDKEVDQRATYEELQQAKGTQNKSTQRKREYEKLIGGKSKVGIVGNSQQHQVGQNAASTGRCHCSTGARNIAHGQGSTSNRRPVKTQGSDRNHRIR